MKRRFVFLVGAFEPRTRITIFDQNRAAATLKARGFLDTIAEFSDREPPVAWTMELLEGYEVA